MVETTWSGINFLLYPLFGMFFSFDCRSVEDTKWRVSWFWLYIYY